MRGKNKQKDLMKQIKEMENDARQTTMLSKPKEATKQEKVDVDTWYFLRSKQIPVHHMKEIIIADFKARGLSNLETMADFDKALESYGVKVK